MFDFEMPREERTSTRRPDQLPPGRHKLSREFIAENQRARILDGVMEAVANVGYQDTRLAEVTTTAGVSRKTFYEHFKDFEDAYLAAYDMHVSALTEAVSDAFLAEGERPGARRWPDRIRAGVNAFLGYLAEHPAAARACMVETFGAGREARARRDAALRSFTFFIDSGRAEAAHDVPGRTATALLGGANEVIAWELLHGTPSKIRQLAPELVYLFVLPFIGPKKALQERDKAFAGLENGARPVEPAPAAPKRASRGSAAKKRGR
jgi:AcrR family transcriptional regulator